MPAQIALLLFACSSTYAFRHDMKFIANAGAGSGTHLALVKAHELGNVSNQTSLGSHASEDDVHFSIRIDGNEIQLNHSMPATATLGDLRQAIKNQFRSSLTFGIKELKRYPAGGSLTDDAETLESLAYKPIGSGAYMVEVVPLQEPRGLKFVVRDPDGKEVLLHRGFSLDETIGDLKTAIEEQFFYEISVLSEYPSPKVLYASEHSDGSELDMALGNHGYRNIEAYARHMVDVVPFPPNHVSEDRLNFRVKIHVTGDFLEGGLFGRKVEKEMFLGCPVNPDATVGHLKMLIENKFGEPVQGLKSYPMEQELDPEKQLSSDSYNPGPGIVYVVKAVSQ